MERGKFNIFASPVFPSGFTRTKERRADKINKAMINSSYHC